MRLRANLRERALRRKEKRPRKVKGERARREKEVRQKRMKVNER